MNNVYGGSLWCGGRGDVFMKQKGLEMSFEERDGGTGCYLLSVLGITTGCLYGCFGAAYCFW